MTKLTPMMAQYHEIKNDYQDYILFFRLGDFYEMFFEDAVTASRVLEITLTKRNAGGGSQAPLCGIPYHALDGYLSKLVGSGYKVAICEQVEDPATAKGIVKREVVRIVTPGTIIDPGMLEEKSNNYIASVVVTSTHYGLAYADVTTGQLKTTSFFYDKLQALMDDIIRISPSELILEDQAEYAPKLLTLFDKMGVLISKKDKRFFSTEASTEMLKRIYQLHSLSGLGIQDEEELIKASGGLLAYIEETQKMELVHFKQLEHYHLGSHMIVDNYTRVNLELTETIRQKDKRGSLLWVLDKTKTAMGARLLKQWIEEPLLDIAKIVKRQDIVKYLYDELLVRADLRHYLDEIYDLERLMTKVVFGSVNARDMLALKSSLAVLPDIKYLISDEASEAMSEITQGFDVLEDVHGMLDHAICDEPPFSLREGGIFKDGYHETLDELRDAIRNGKQWLLEVEERERERTGIKNLKIGFNKVFGYFIEISKGQVKNAPEDYIRKQTLANAERYIMPELKTIEDKILGAEERINKLEYELFVSLRELVLLEIDRIRQIAKTIASLDVLTSFAEVSEKNNYVPPVLTGDPELSIVSGRHPVVERIGTEEQFVPNNTVLDTTDDMVYIITGPNMAGKSTYLRQVALITLMAQIGCFVPADSATIGVVDRIFTRVGASDDLFHGQSTFMVEMNELANILNNATHKSLIILDEIGRGTSTYDGLSIAWSVVEFIANSMGAKTIFATHYHELTELEGKIGGVKNYCISVREEGDQIVFLRKIIRGGANQSFGIQVAKLAGVPNHVIHRAKAILSELEASDIASPKIDVLKSKSSKVATEQLSMMDFTEDPVTQELKQLDITAMTPMQAMGKLHELIERAKEK
ncbi:MULTISPECIES: DNA mismatch repair protein MutS [unclassified Fusibacter]|uniref:DNA mismatch repair protein MutS n=1 Tax=unclassified Fusibacter TaxID=2624464 RepID=UPI00101206A1|nr:MULTISPECIES: DNA mismatch repair protein MutS [unclassified Fusibacter]MCK8058831.1 DNA mismatch repair protein MutS [Fusibacter sp. A2]NPE21905.1 DNA mismatch repair protein MutS [Fusibacter sp. A1]RXV61476.1 DNA mismatch repair protein MutS [Fusibacter sp. A1]